MPRDIARKRWSDEVDRLEGLPGAEAASAYPHVGASPGSCQGVVGVGCTQSTLNACDRSSTHVPQLEFQANVPASSSDMPTSRVAHTVLSTISSPFRAKASFVLLSSIAILHCSRPALKPLKKGARDALMQEKVSTLLGCNQPLLCCSRHSTDHCQIATVVQHSVQEDSSTVLPR